MGPPNLLHVRTFHPLFLYDASRQITDAALKRFVPAELWPDAEPEDESEHVWWSDLTESQKASFRRPSATPATEELPLDVIEISLCFYDREQLKQRLRLERLEEQLKQWPRLGRHKGSPLVQPYNEPFTIPYRLRPMLRFYGFDEYRFVR